MIAQTLVSLRHLRLISVKNPGAHGTIFGVKCQSRRRYFFCVSLISGSRRFSHYVIIIQYVIMTTPGGSGERVCRVTRSLRGFDEFPEFHQEWSHLSSLLNEYASVGRGRTDVSGATNPGSEQEWRKNCPPLTLRLICCVLRSYSQSP